MSHISLSQSEESLLLEILRQPSAPFREGPVISVVTRILKEANVPFFLDSQSNCVIGAASEKEYKKRLSPSAAEPLRIFIAHMDHPGFHGVRWCEDNRLEVQWHGGSPTAHLEGARVWLSPSQSLGPNSETPFLGTLHEPTLVASGRALKTAKVQISKEHLGNLRPLKAQDLFGGFGFRSPAWKESSNFYTKAADDLVGTFSIVALALKHAKSFRKSKSTSKDPYPKFPMIGLLTRAEEVGFIGALAHENLGYFKKAKRPLLFISLETSRALPGAEIGKGPVVRLGDRSTVFSPGPLKALSLLAQRILPDSHQRRIMDGGTCEGTVFTAFGYDTIGISVPLGNYHNQSIEGGPDAAPPQGPAPEYVHESDVAGLLTLCEAIVLNKAFDLSAPFAQQKTVFKKELKHYSKLLKTKP